MQSRTVVAGRYEVMQLLGMGGSSEVWWAIDRVRRAAVAIRPYCHSCGGKMTYKE